MPCTSCMCSFMQSFLHVLCPCTYRSLNFFINLYELSLICCTPSFNWPICFRALREKRGGDIDQTFQKLCHLISLSQNLSHLVFSHSIPRFITDLSCWPGSALQARAQVCPAGSSSYVHRRFWRPLWGLCCRAGLRGVEANRPGDGEKALKALMATWASTEAEGTVQK